MKKNKKENQSAISEDQNLADIKESQLDSKSAQQTSAEIENGADLDVSVPQAKIESNDAHDSAEADNHEVNPNSASDKQTKSKVVVTKQQDNTTDKVKVSVKVINATVAPLPFDDHDASKIVSYDIEAQNASLVRQSALSTVNNTGEKTDSAKRNELLVHDLYNVPHQVQESVTVDLLQADITAEPVEVIPQDTWLGYGDQEKLIQKSKPDLMTDLEGNPYALQYDTGVNTILPDPSEVKIPVNIKIDPGFANVHPTLSDQVIASSGEVFNMDGAIASNYNSVGKEVTEEEIDPLGPKQLSKDDGGTPFIKTLVGLPQTFGPAAFIQVLNGSSYDYQVKNNYISDSKGNFINLAKNTFRLTLQPISANSLYQSTDSRHLALAAYTDSKLKLDDDGSVKSAGNLRLLGINSSTSSLETSGTVYSVQQVEKFGGQPKKDRTLIIDTKTGNSERFWQKEMEIDKTLFKDEWKFITLIDKWNENFNNIKKQSRFGDGTGLDSLTAQVLRFATNDRITDNTLLLLNTYSAVKALYNSLLIRPKLNKLSKVYLALYNPSTLTNIKKILKVWKDSGNFLVWKDSTTKLVDLMKLHKLHEGELYDKRNPLVSKVIGFMSNYDISDPAHQYSTLLIPSPTAMRDSITNATIDYGMISSNMLNGERLVTFDGIASTALSYNNKKNRRRVKSYDFTSTVFSSNPINYKDLYLASAYNTDKSSEFKPFKPIKSEVKGTISEAHLETSVTTNDDGWTTDIRVLHESNVISDYALQYLLQLSALQLFFTKNQRARVEYNNVVDKYGLPLALSSFPELLLNATEIISDLEDTIDWLIARYDSTNIMPNGDYRLEDLRQKLNAETKPFTTDQTALALNNLWSTTPYLGRVQKPSAYSELLSNLASITGGVDSLQHITTVLLNSTLSRSHLKVDYNIITADKALNAINKSRALYHSSAEFIDLVYNTRTGEYTFKPTGDGSIITRRLRMPSFTDVDAEQKLKPNGLVFSTKEDLDFPLSQQYMKYILLKPTSALLPFFPEFYLKDRVKNSFIPISVISEEFSTYKAMIKDHKLLSALIVRPNPDSTAGNLIKSAPMLIQPMNFVFYSRNDAYLGDGVYDHLLPYNVFKANEQSNYLQLADVVKLAKDKEYSFIKYLTPYSLLKDIYDIDLGNVYTQTDDSYRVLPYLNNLIARIRDYYKGLVVKFTTNSPQVIQPDVIEQFLVEKHIATYKLSDIKQNNTDQSSSGGLPISSVESEIAPENLKI